MPTFIQHRKKVKNKFYPKKDLSEPLYPGVSFIARIEFCMGAILDRSGYLRHLRANVNFLSNSYSLCGKLIRLIWFDFYSVRKLQNQGVSCFFILKV